VLGYWVVLKGEAEDKEDRGEKKEKSGREATKGVFRREKGEK